MRHVIFLTTFLLATIRITAAFITPGRKVQKAGSVVLSPRPFNPSTPNHILFDIPKSATGRTCSIFLGTFLSAGETQLHTLNLQNPSQPYQDQHIATFYGVGGGFLPTVKGYPAEKLYWTCKEGIRGFVMNKNGEWWGESGLKVFIHAVEYNNTLEDNKTTVVPSATLSLGGEKLHEGKGDKDRKGKKAGDDEGLKGGQKEEKDAVRDGDAEEQNLQVSAAVVGWSAFGVLWFAALAAVGVVM